MYLCLGMFSSASTWLYNLVRRLAIAQMPEHPVTACYIDDMAAQAAAQTAVLVIKTHGSMPNTNVAAAQARRIFITIRDPRDCIASMVTHNKLSFDQALNLTMTSARVCFNHARDSRSLLLRFEDRFFEAPQTIQRISAALPGVLRAEDACTILKESRREAIDAFIAGMTRSGHATRVVNALSNREDIYDPETHWHGHHAGRRAETGRFARELAPGQVARIEEQMQAWMEYFSYLPATRPEGQDSIVPSPARPFTPPAAR